MYYKTPMLKQFTNSLESTCDKIFFSRVDVFG